MARPAPLARIATALALAAALCIPAAATSAAPPAPAAVQAPQPGYAGVVFRGAPEGLVLHTRTLPIETPAEIGSFWFAVGSLAPFCVDAELNALVRPSSCRAGAGPAARTDPRLDGSAARRVSPRGRCRSSRTSRGVSYSGPASVRVIARSRSHTR